MANVRFFRRGKTHAYFLTALADPDAPTVDEIAAGVELTGEINDIAGFSYATERIETPDLASPFTSQIGGPQKADDSSFTLYLRSETNPLRTTLAQDAAGFVVFQDFKLPAGPPEADDLVDVYPVIIIGRPKRRSVGNDPALWECQFGITDVPSEDVVVAAGS